MTILFNVITVFVLSTNMKAILLGHSNRLFLKRLHWLQFDRAEIKQDEGNYAWEPVGYKS